MEKFFDFIYYGHFYLRCAIGRLVPFFRLIFTLVCLLAIYLYFNGSREDYLFVFVNALLMRLVAYWWIDTFERIS